jgi:hypothetical protein
MIFAGDKHSFAEFWYVPDINGNGRGGGNYKHGPTDRGKGCGGKANKKSDANKVCINIFDPPWGGGTTLAAMMVLAHNGEMKR